VTDFLAAFRSEDLPANGVPNGNREQLQREISGNRCMMPRFPSTGRRGRILRFGRTRLDVGCGGPQPPKPTTLYGGGRM